MRTIGKSILVVTVALLVGGSLLHSPPARAQSVEEDSGLHQAFEQAGRDFLHQHDDQAIQALEQIVADPLFESTSYSFRMNVHLLLAKIYYFKDKLEKVKQQIRVILESDWHFDFAADSTSAALLEIVDQVKESMQASQPRAPLTFAFVPDCDTTKPLRAKVNETTTVQVGTTPDTVSVTLKLAQPENGLTLTQTGANRVSLSFTPDAAEVGTIRRVALVGETADTSMTLELAFEVKAAGKSNLWKYLAGGAGAVATAAVIIATSGSDTEEEAETKLPSPPGHPADQN
ncbi:MAG: hypothetical protein ABIJ61_01805 [bacterium]